MKVSFHATYGEVARLLKPGVRSASNEGEPGQFAKLLRNISPRDAQSPETKEGLSTASIKQQVERGDPPSPMGSLKLPSPRAQVPDPGRLLPPLGADLSVNEPVADVKTPTIVDARRVSALANESHSKRVEVVQEMLTKASNYHGVDPLLGMAVVSAESSFNPNAVSSDGLASKGLFQLLDSTGKNLMQRAGLNEEYNPFDPKLNIDLGVRYLRYLHKIFSSDTELPNQHTTRAAANSSSLEKLAVAAFNAGEGRVASAQQRAQSAGLDPTDFQNVEAYLPESTREYVSRVMANRLRFGGEYFPSYGSDLDDLG